MGRPRKIDKHLPRGMYRRHGAYYFVAPGGKWHPLGKDYGPALIQYAGFVGSAPTVTTVRDAVSHYLESSAARLRPATIEGYRHSAERLCAVFGRMALTDLDPSHVYRYLVEHGNVQANRDRALLSASYSHARRIGAFRGDDPAKGLQFRNPETARQRYVSDAELDALIAAASPKLGCIMRFCFLTGMRQGDVLRVRLPDIDAEGVHYTSGKTGKRRVVTWSPELRECVDEANRLFKRAGRIYLFESRPRGRRAKAGPGPYTPSGLRALYRVARAKAGLADVTLHDLRRKAGSDVDEPHAQALLAHSDSSVTRKHYRAKPERVKPVR
jgi:integrase